MAGPSDISTILSQTGRIEKINQNPFVQAEVTKQILTEEEAQARLRKNREVAESKKAQEIAVRDRAKEERRRGDEKEGKAKDSGAPDEDQGSTGEKHLIDVVV